MYFFKIITSALFHSRKRSQKGPKTLSQINTFQTQMCIKKAERQITYALFYFIYLFIYL